MGKEKRGDRVIEGEEDLERGNLFATGLVAGGALLGVVFAFLNISTTVTEWLKALSVEHTLTGSLGQTGYYLLSAALFACMGYTLYNLGSKKPV